LIFNLDISTYPWPNTDRLPSPTNDETSLNNPDQAKKLYLLGKNLHMNIFHLKNKNINF